MKRTAEIASAGFICYDKERRAQCVYCMEMVDFKREHRPAMLAHAEAGLHCSMVLEKLLNYGGEPLPAKPLDGENEEKRKALWKDLRDFFAEEDDEHERCKLWPSFSKRAMFCQPFLSI